MLFDSRELAILIWMFLALVLAASSKRIRPSLIQVGKALVQSKLLVLWLTMLTYIGGLIWLLAVSGIWTTDLVGETSVLVPRARHHLVLSVRPSHQGSKVPSSSVALNP